MAKKNNLPFNAWDIISFLIIAGFVYGVFKGIDGSWWRVFQLFASGIFFALVVVKVNKYVIQKASKK